MRVHRVLLGVLWLALSLAGLTSCNTGEGVTDPAVQFANLRIANFIPDASGPINVTLDGNNFASGVNFETVTTYTQINSGQRSIQVSVAGSANNIISITPTFIGITNYTGITYGSVDDPSSLLVPDNILDPGAGFFGLRAVNVAKGSGSIDVYATVPGADLNLAAPNVSNVAVGGISPFVNIPVGTVEIRVTTAGTKDVIYDAQPQTFTEHSQVETAVYTRESSKLVGVTLMNIDTTGTSVTKPNLLAQFKVINGSSAASPLNIFVDQNLLLSNIPVGGASSYQKTLAGSTTLNVEATATPGAPLLTITPTLASGTDSSILLTGPAGALKALVLSDQNLPPISTRAQVRFVNGTTDISALDVYVNFSKLIASLAMNSAASGFQFDADPTAGTNYNFDFNIAGTSQPSLSLPGVTLFGGQVYTIYVVGTVGALSGIVTADN
jgi:Domain of unknown function (DUF4397)